MKREIPPRVRPLVLVVARTLNEAQGYARGLPERHVEIMTAFRATHSHALHGLAPGTTVHVLLSESRGDDLADVALDAAIEHARHIGADVHVRVEPQTPARGVDQPPRRGRATQRRNG